VPMENDGGRLPSEASGDVQIVIRSGWPASRQKPVSKKNIN
jgi:hypothetical protein